MSRDGGGREETEREGKNRERGEKKRDTLERHIKGWECQVIIQQIQTK